MALRRSGNRIEHPMVSGSGSNPSDVGGFKWRHGPDSPRPEPVLDPSVVRSPLAKVTLVETE
jgi:hypothetical protein